VEQDAIASTQTPVDIQPVSQQAPCISQILSQNELNGEWGLGRISHYHRYSATTNIGWPTYLYDEYIGKCPAGGTAYVLDSGVTTGHPEFTTGRATFGFKSNSVWPSHDVCGHGTHVAGIIGGNKYGVMKKAKLISVKVLEGSGGACSGPWSGIIAGINWAFNDAVANGRLKTSVMNLSLGWFSHIYIPPMKELWLIL